MSRLIDADAIRYTEYKCRDTLADGSYSEFYSEYRVDKRRIDSMPTVNQWIPCSERLPEQRPYRVDDPEGQLDIIEDYSMISDYVLVQTSDGEMAVAFYEDDLDGRIYWQTYPCEYLEVIAWMPLPEPYTEAEP